MYKFTKKLITETMSRVRVCVRVCVRACVCNLTKNSNCCYCLQPVLSWGRYVMSAHVAARRDVYLQFKALNVSRSGLLSLDEFYALYDIANLKWKVGWCQHMVPPDTVPFWTAEETSSNCHVEMNNLMNEMQKSTHPGIMPFCPGNPMVQVSQWCCLTKPQCGTTVS